MYNVTLQIKMNIAHMSKQLFYVSTAYYIILWYVLNFKLLIPSNTFSGNCTVKLCIVCREIGVTVINNEIRINCEYIRTSI